MYDIRKAFGVGAVMPSAANDDDASVILFSQPQMAMLNGFITAYIRSGHVTGFEYKSGPNNSCFTAKCDKPRAPFEPNTNTVFCIAIRQAEGEPVRYDVNIGKGDKVHKETLNFDEVLRTIRSGMQRLFPNVDTHQRHISLV